MGGCESAKVVGLVICNGVCNSGCDSQAGWCLGQLTLDSCCIGLRTTVCPHQIESLRQH
jgi:hypothetical protein